MKLKSIFVYGAVAAAGVGVGVGVGAGVLLGVVWACSGPGHKKGGAR